MRRRLQQVLFILLFLVGLTLACGAQPEKTIFPERYKDVVVKISLLDKEVGSKIVQLHIPRCEAINWYFCDVEYLAGFEEVLGESEKVTDEANRLFNNQLGFTKAGLEFKALSTGWGDPRYGLESRIESFVLDPNKEGLDGLNWNIGYRPQSGSQGYRLDIRDHGEFGYYITLTTPKGSLLSFRAKTPLPDEVPTLDVFAFNPTGEKEAEVKKILGDLFAGESDVVATFHIQPSDLEARNIFAHTLHRALLINASAEEGIFYLGDGYSGMGSRVHFSLDIHGGATTSRKILGGLIWSEDKTSYPEITVRRTDILGTVVAGSVYRIKATKAE